ncbi:MAG: hypothetical protein LUC31_02095 [Coprobacillus sp.]|nr:hypothetical protein [Coprobacillus sp.]
MKIKTFSLLALLFASTVSLSGCNFGGNSSDDNYYKSSQVTYTYYDYGLSNVYNTKNVLSKGDVNILVIPTIIKGYESSATEENRERINEAFFGDSETTGWESVTSYYYKSSYGALNISGEVTPWFDLGLSPSELYAKQSRTYGEYGTFYALEQAFIWAVSEQDIDMAKYDNDDDGFVDAIILIYSAPNYSNWGPLSSLGEQYGYWAFTYWDYTFIYEGGYFKDSETGEVYPYCPHGYCWMSYDFMDQGHDGDNDIDIDAHTYIHEFGHLLGLDDYYDTDNEHAPMGYCDMMDANIGDHCAYTKYALGWVKPYVVTGNAKITIRPFATSGDCIVLKYNASSRFYDNAFNEYLMIEYITPEELWEYDASHGYIAEGLNAYTTPGIRVTHVDSRLAYPTSSVFGSMVYTAVDNPNTYSGVTYQLYCSNTTSRSLYQTDMDTLHPDLVSMITNINVRPSLALQTSSAYFATSDCLLKKGESFSTSIYKDYFINGKMHDGTKLNYSFTIDALSSESATITFKKG